MYKSGVEPFMGEAASGEAVVLDPEVSLAQSVLVGHVRCILRDEAVMTGDARSLARSLREGNTISPVAYGVGDLLFK